MDAVWQRRSTPTRPRSPSTSGASARRSRRPAEPRHLQTVMGRRLPLPAVSPARSRQRYRGLVGPPRRRGYGAPRRRRRRRAGGARRGGAASCTCSPATRRRPGASAQFASASPAWSGLAWAPLARARCSSRPAMRLVLGSLVVFAASSAFAQRDARRTRRATWRGCAPAWRPWAASSGPAPAGSAEELGQLAEAANTATPGGTARRRARQADRGRLPRPAHAARVAAAAGRGRRRRRRRRRTRRGYLRADAHPHRRAARRWSTTSSSSRGSTPATSSGRCERVQLGELVERDGRRAARRRPTPGVGRRGGPAGEHRPARANPEKVQRVLFNLIQNAIRHTPADGSVTVRAEPRRRRVEIEVADNGDGIGADDRARVFEPFSAAAARRARTRRRRPRPGDLARDRRGARRAHLDRRGRAAPACASRCRTVRPAFEYVPSVLGMGGGCATMSSTGDCWSRRRTASATVGSTAPRVPWSAPAARSVARATNAPEPLAPARRAARSSTSAPAPSTCSPRFTARHRGGRSRHLAVGGSARPAPQPPARCTRASFTWVLSGVLGKVLLSTATSASAVIPSACSRTSPNSAPAGEAIIESIRGHGASVVGVRLEGAGPGCGASFDWARRRGGCATVAPTRRLRIDELHGARRLVGASAQGDG